MSQIEPTSLLRMPDVCRRTGLSRSTIYDLLAAGSFPKAVPLTPSRRAWRSDELARWIDERTAARDEGRPA